MVERTPLSSAVALALKLGVARETVVEWAKRIGVPVARMTGMPVDQLCPGPTKARPPERSAHSRQ